MAAEPQWLTTPADSGELATFEHGFELPSTDGARLRIAALDDYRVFLNGTPLAADDTPCHAETFDVTGLVKQGANILKVDVHREAKAEKNSWIELYVGLETPCSGTKLTFTTRGARHNEWLYLDIEDAAGSTSGYYALESGRSDFVLGTSGAVARHTVDLGTEKVIDATRKGRVDLTRIRRITFRIDQKDAWSAPAGRLEIGDIWLDGPGGKLDVASINRWQLVAGHGEVGAKTLGYTEDGFVGASWRFGSPPALAARLVAFSGGGKVADVVTDATWRVDGTPADPRPDPEGIFKWIDMRSPSKHSRLTLPVNAVVRVALDIEGDRVEVGKSVSGHVRAWALGEVATARLHVRDWHDQVVAVVDVPLVADDSFYTGDVTLSPLPVGLYRIEAAVEGVGQPRRFTSLAVLPQGEKRLGSVFATLSPMAPRPGRQGLNTSYEDSAALLLAIRELGVNSVVMHVQPEFFHQPEFPELLSFCKAAGLRFALNNEFANWMPAPESWKEGEPNPLSAAGGCHRWDLPAEALKACAATGLFDGVVYDEGEHMQLCRNNYSRLADPVHRKPYLVETTGLSLQEAHQAFTKAAEVVRVQNETWGARLLVESVFPVLWHPLAAAGVTLCPKLLKEDVHPVVLAQALGAAKQYDAELWFSPDFWYLGRFPGHTPEEYQWALDIAWKAGVDNVYTEHQMALARLAGPDCDITPWGEVLQNFIAAHPDPAVRGYTYRDVRPEVAIIRFPDSDWGQAAASYWDMLYGGEDLHSTPATREWMKVWNVLSGGTINEACINYNSPVYAGEWCSAFPCPAAVVYDHLVEYEPLRGLGWIFVCGVEPPSPTTLRAIDRSVREGAVCFIPQRLLPAPPEGEMPRVLGRERADQGWWVVLEGYESEQLQPYRDLLPPVPAGMKLRFAGGVEIEIDQGLALP